MSIIKTNPILAETSKFELRLGKFGLYIKCKNKDIILRLYEILANLNEDGINDRFILKIGEYGTYFHDTSSMCDVGMEDIMYKYQATIDCGTVEDDEDDDDE